MVDNLIKGGIVSAGERVGFFVDCQSMVTKMRSMVPNTARVATLFERVNELQKVVAVFFQHVKAHTTHGIEINELVDTLAKEGLKQQLDLLQRMRNGDETITLPLEPLSREAYKEMLKDGIRTARIKKLQKLA